MSLYPLCTVPCFDITIKYIDFKLNFASYLFLIFYHFHILSVFLPLLIGGLIGALVWLAPFFPCIFILAFLVIFNEEAYSFTHSLTPPLSPFVGGTEAFWYSDFSFWLSFYPEFLNSLLHIMNIFAQ